MESGLLDEARRTFELERRLPQRGDQLAGRQTAYHQRLNAALCASLDAGVTHNVSPEGCINEIRRLRLRTASYRPEVETRQVT